MTYSLTKLAGLRWRVTCPDRTTFHTSSLDEALTFIRQHATTAAAKEAGGTR